MTTGLKIAIGIGAFLVIVGLVFLVLCLTKVINCGGGGGSPGRRPFGASETHSCSDGSSFTCNGGTKGCMDNSTMYCK